MSYEKIELICYTGFYIAVFGYSCHLIASVLGGVANFIDWCKK